MKVAARRKWLQKVQGADYIWAVWMSFTLEPKCRKPLNCSSDTSSLTGWPVWFDDSKPSQWGLHQGWQLRDGVQWRHVSFEQAFRRNWESDGWRMGCWRRRCKSNLRQHFVKLLFFQCHTWPEFLPIKASLLISILCRRNWDEVFVPYATAEVLVYSC